MDPSYRAIKEEFPGINNSSSSSSSSSSPYSSSTFIYSTMAANSSSPQPMEGLRESGPPPFLTKTYDIVEDSRTNHIVSWSKHSNSFVVWDPQAFAMSLLPRHFKHSNFSSFVRQLNTYGFRKVNPDRWEFANEGFLRGQKHLLKSIRRRKCNNQQQTPQQQSLDSCVEVGRFGLDGEIDRLRRDKQALMMELVRLRQQQQNTKSYLTLMEEKLKKTETKQQQMMSFLARAMQNPEFVQQLVHQKDKRKELEEAINKKRRRPIDRGTSNVIDVVGDGDNDHGHADAYLDDIKQETYQDMSEFGVLELDRLAMDIQGHGDNTKEECCVNVEEEEEEDEGFWEDLLNEYHINIQEDLGILGGEEENVDDLVEQLGCLGSIPR
ncbi:PREDICTED: heat stress transcription factor A-6b [Tarenaya hassleriana]|uniref:heat stress transcription factor A-6b n=1 Tax=Tarenaya hassleriana TaxID=28532 RepID=UPI00053C95D8|nr:PREDICTED: heat stress transcription factor A-6b [Tarenaya hassleriana]